MNRRNALLGLLAALTAPAGLLAKIPRPNPRRPLSIVHRVHDCPIRWERVRLAEIEKGQRFAIQPDAQAIPRVYLATGDAYLDENGTWSICAVEAE